jgi:hypothetical protein
VNPRTRTPLNAVWLVVAFCSVLNLVGLGSTETIVAIFSITAPALDLSYVAVIVARFWYSSEVPFINGPFTLGKYGWAINIIAVVWVCFVSIVLFLPPSWPISPANMNYAICVAGFMALFALSWWWLGAREYEDSFT